MVRKVWETVGNRVRLAVDGNRGMPTRDALLLSQACRDIPFVLEQPCDSLDEIAAIRAAAASPGVSRRRGHRPADRDPRRQWSRRWLWHENNPYRGLTPMATFRDLCEARHLPHTVDDSWGGDIIAAACVQMGATVNPKLFEGTWLAQPYIEGHYDPTQGIAIENGYIPVPGGPGLGVVPDEAIFTRTVASF